MHYNEDDQVRNMLRVPQSVLNWCEENEIEPCWLRALVQYRELTTPYKNLVALCTLLRQMIPFEDEAYGVLPIELKEEICALWHFLEVANDPFANRKIFNTTKGKPLEAA